MRKLSVIIVVFVGLTVPQTTEADLIHNGADPNLYLAHAANFSEWVQPFGRYDSSGFDLGGSVTMLHPGGVHGGWLYPAMGIAAAHSGLRNANDPSSLYDGFAVSFTRNFFTDPQPWIDAFDVAVHPNYGGFGSGPDLMLVFFDAEFDYRPLNLYTGPHTVGDRYHSAGFGIFGTPAMGLEGFTGDLWAGTNQLTATDVFGGLLQFRFERPGFAGFEELGSQSTPGSSGGGLFPEDWDTSLLLAGNTTRWGGGAGYNAFSFFTPFTDDDVSWIQHEHQLRATVIPEPGSLCYLAIGAALLAGHRLRRAGCHCWLV